MHARLPEKLLPVAASALMAAVLGSTAALTPIDLFILDRVQGAYQRPPPDDIIIVGIDQKSLDDLGPWPWSRRRHGELTRRLMHAGARMILIDLLFATPDPSDPDGDAAFVQAVGESGRVVLPVAIEALRPGGQLVEVLPFAALSSSAAALGHADVEVDLDGRVRSVFLRAGLGEPVWPTLALAALRIAGEMPTAASSHEPPGDKPRDPFFWNRADRVLVPFAGPPGHFRHVSYSDVLSGKVPAELFKQALVLIGVTADSIGDRFTAGSIDATRLMSGIEFIANVIDALRRDLALVALGRVSTASLTLVLVVASACLYATRLPPWIVLVSGALAVLATSAGVLIGLRMWFPPASALLGIGLTYAGIVWLEVRNRYHRLKAREDEANATLRSISDGVIIVGPDTTVEHINPVALRLSGLSVAMAVSHPADALFDLRDVADHAKVTISSLMAAAASARERLVTRSVILRPAKGGDRRLQLSVAILPDGPPDVKGAVLAFHDTAELRRVMRKIFEQGKRDPVTGLPDRIGFLAALAWSFEQAKDTGEPLSVLIVNMDGFRRFNDTFGYDAGDTLLAAAAQRLLTIRRGIDNVARLGDDEFGLVTVRGTSESAVSFIARRTKKSLENPYNISDRMIAITVSVGIASFPRDGDDIDTLVRSARRAARIARNRGSHIVAGSSNKDNIFELSRVRSASQLRSALQEGQFELHYQPQVDLQSGQFIGVEALLRWRSPSRGLLFPSTFLPALEDNGLIVDIGEWVFQTACQQMQEWSGLVWPRFRMSVNVSPYQFLDKQFINNTIRVIDHFNVDSRLVNLEITENVMIHNFDMVARIIQRLTAKGISFAIDDFGAGYASILHLRNIPVSNLKIDKSIIHNSAHDAREAAIFSGIVTMAHSMGLMVVAEGVETDRHVEFVRSHGCDQAQGFFFGEAVPPTQALSRLRSSWRWV
jgi:diguanylate cyclase (GGDEF)-like protein